MQSELLERLVLSLLGCCALVNCKEAPKPASKNPALVAASSSATLTPAPNVEAPASGCKASGSAPTKLGSTVGSVFGFAGDATHLYYTSWQLYGSRGNLGKVRKDGAGSEALVSLTLEPRSIAIDASDVYYTEGIRLSKLPKAGGTPSVIAPKFSSLNIAMDPTQIFGVPGDYGPYDRLVKVAKTGGVNWELDVTTRPESKTGPVGYNGIAVDAAGVYVTDSGNNRVLRFALERAKPKVIAPGQPKAFDLATDQQNVYFTLADKGNLMMVPKAGGAVKKLVSGLVPKSRIAADDAHVIAVLAGANESAPSQIVKIPAGGGEPTKVASVEGLHSVEALTLDKDCVYWVEHTAGSSSVEFYAVPR